MSEVTTSHMASSIVKISDSALYEAAELISRGQLVAFPTETVYGLGAKASNGRAVSRIFRAKGRPVVNPLIVHVADMKMAEKYGELSLYARQLARCFWPGPLTLIVPKKPDAPLADLVSAGLPTIGLRIPGHEGARKLIKMVGSGIAAPSANLSGHVSASLPAHVFDDFGNNIAMILDDGLVKGGLESTICMVQPDHIQILRPGSISKAQIEEVACLPTQIKEAGDEKIVAPGGMKSHYAPKKPVRLNAENFSEDEAVLQFGPLQEPLLDEQLFILSADGNLEEAAQNLYRALRAADQSSAKSIAICPIREEGLGIAINERLRRASFQEDALEKTG